LSLKKLLNINAIDFSNAKAKQLQPDLPTHSQKELIDNVEMRHASEPDGEVSVPLIEKVAPNTRDEAVPEKTVQQSENVVPAHKNEDIALSVKNNLLIDLKVLSTKVQHGGTDHDQGFWLDALTTSELTAGLLLLLAGAGCLIAGLVLGWMILTGIGVIPLVIGAGILLIPVGSTLWHRRIPPSQECDHTIEREGDLWPTTFPVHPTPVLLPTPLDASKLSSSQNTGEKRATEFTL
jgi:hypothetical protein